METLPTDAEGVLAARASFAQERMWLLEQMEDDAATYNVQMGLRFLGDFDAGLLRSALDNVVARHEILRTTLETSDGELTQIIAPPAPVPLPLIDLTGEPPARLTRLSEEERDRAFDPAAEAPIRALIARTSPTEHVLLVTLDHIAADAASLHVLHGELLALYRAGLSGTAPELPELEIQYADYADWQREWLSGPELDRQVEHWRSTLDGSGPLDLGEPGPVRVPSTANRIVPAELIDGLTGLATLAGAPMYTVLLSAYALALAERTGRADLVIGTLLNGRTRTEIEPLIGFFVNTVALRLDLSGRPTHRELVERAAAVTLDAYAHQDAPFDQIVAELNPVRAAGRPPFFDVMFQLADLDHTPVDLPGVRIEPLALASAPAPVDLVFAIIRENGEHLGVWDHDAAILPPGAIAALQDGFERALSAMAADPDARIPDYTGKARLATVDASGSSVVASAELTPLAEEIGAIWSELLQRPEIGPGDDFFDLGGHSLAATRLIIRLRAELGFPLPVRVIFDHPVLADFAAAVEEKAIAAAG